MLRTYECVNCSRVVLLEPPQSEPMCDICGENRALRAEVERLKALMKVYAGR
jgi:rRNA maturation endonuclease Nob1